MNWHSLLLSLFGARVDRADSVAQTEFAFRHDQWLGGAILAAVGLGALTWWSYRRDTTELTSKAQRSALASLRIAFWLLLLLLLLRPVLLFTIEATVRRTLVLLIDTSTSMLIEDPRFDETDQKRAAIARGHLDAREGLEQKLTGAPAKPISRKDLLVRILANDALQLEQRLERDCDLQVFTFGKETTDAGKRRDLAHWLPTVSFQANATSLGDAMREVLQRKRGQALAGVVIFTDGANNTGTSPLDAAREASREKVPLLTVGLGATSPRDIIVAGILAQETAFVDEELVVTIRVRAQGLKGEPASLSLHAGQELIASRDVQISSDAEQSITIPYTPKQTGEFEMLATIDPRPDEAVKDNNSATQRVRVVDSRIKVLYVESSPRWEFRYVQSAMVRDRRLDSKFVLLEADPSIAEAVDSPYLPHFPETKEELFKFDLLILGDVGPVDIASERLAWIEEFVSKFGGSCLLLAGPRANPQSWKGSPIEKLLPVELAAGGPTPAQRPERGTTFELTSQGKAHPFLQLAGTPEESAAVWSRFGRLYWVARVGRAKAAAQVLLADNDPATSTRSGKMPLAALQQYGLGQVLYVGTDNTWRWRKNAGEPYHAQLWAQMIQKHGMQRIVGGSRRTQITADHQSYLVGDRATIFAKLYQTDFTPVRVPQVEATVTIQGRDSRQAISLRPIPEQPGMYRGEFTPLTSGTHQVKVAVDADAALDLEVAEPRYELGASAMNEALLRQMAELSNGAFFREESLIHLPEAIRSRTETVQTRVDAEVWSSPLMLLLLVTLPTIEWALRKRWQLK